MVATAMGTPEILHEDDRIVVLDKPAGLLSVPGIGPANQACLSRWMQARHSGARIVHRLDRETSGVIVMALDAEAHRELSRQFEHRLVEKRYIAVAAGVPGDDAGEIQDAYALQRAFGKIFGAHTGILAGFPSTDRSETSRAHLTDPDRARRPKSTREIAGTAGTTQRCDGHSRILAREGLATPNGF